LNDDPLFSRNLVLLRADPLFQILEAEKKLYVEFLIRDLEREGAHVASPVKGEIEERIAGLTAEFFWH
jgi:hypothetical protein